ncbi:MAG: hypothetical protein LBU34_11330 [Planctomycetaceae bacterium]|jgi:hypothetical protein|nr:hypothetical protein [Planctomycetaceae bacterium]
MCITVGEAKRNLRIGISQPDTKTKGRQPLAVAVASALADSEFVQCWLFRLPIGSDLSAKRRLPFVGKLP